MAISLGIFVAFFLYPNTELSSMHYKLGDIALKNIKSPRDFLIEDEESTNQRIKEAEKDFIVVYDFDPNLSGEIQTRLTSSFTLMRDLYKEIDYKIKSENTAKTTKTNLASFSKQINANRKEFQKILTDINDEEFRVLERYRFNKRIEKYIGTLINVPLENEIVGNKELLHKEKGRGIIIRNIETKEEVKVKDISSIIGIKDAKKVMEANSNKIPGNIPDSLRNTVMAISQGLIEPNLTFNKNETARRKNIVRESVKPVFYQVKKGEIIVREGERIKNEHMIKLKVFQRAKRYGNLLFISFGIILLVVLLCYILYNFALKNFKGIQISNKDLLLLTITTGLFVLFAKLAILICEAVSNSFPLIPFNSCLYVIPIASGAMLISILLNVRVALVFSLTISILAGMLFENRLEFFIYSFFGSIVAANGVILTKFRTALMKTGAIVGLTNVITILSINMIKGSLFTFTTVFDITFGFLGGLLVGFIVIGTTPLFETLFGYITDIKLLELANLDSPKMRELIVRAPGTYHHSIIVGTLAEAAAETINANPLLAKVSAYYHDIGKINKPLYFVENQIGGENKHEKLAPSMSSLILLSHVKDGVEIAKESKLGQPIIDIIQQHHGTSLINFFYQKAKDKENPELHPVDEKDYRYPGPKPQTKEAGLVLLADAVEAASKTIPDPSPSRIQGMVHRIINNIFVDGQLNECELTLKDLNEIAKSFNKILTGIFHQRIEYPEQAYKETEGKKKLDDIDKKSTKQDKSKRIKDKKNGENDLKRLGMS
ncbi:MAG: HDIG domain-containing metalloprotein [Pseudomonadota bacterium]